MFGNLTIINAGVAGSVWKAREVIPVGSTRASYPASGKI